ncbi:hypothetical protein [Nocardioides campestrisoli]|uniref:hypothetical protein n=1 Tax=Nocardioides campestrisoli TaxID=2736757 RepID=UPI0015E6BDAB|nr:hypothetical protein [Nocardioides campestrisoli]
MTVHLPAPKEVRDLLADLLGRDVVISPTAPLAPSAESPATFAVYVDDSFQVAAVIVLDVALSAYAGAAIGLVPPTVAKNSIRWNVLTPLLEENLREVLNVTVNLFHSGDSDHLRLHVVHPAGGPVPQDVLARSLTLGRRTDVSVQVAGYGTGVLSVVLAP